MILKKPFIGLAGQPMALSLHSVLAFILLGLATHAAAQIATTPLHSLAPPPGVQSGGQAGWAVATDGVRTVVGTLKDDTGADDAGVVKVYDAVTGALQFVLLNPTPTANDQFGCAVAISGTRVVVGALYDDQGAADAGAVHVYDLGGATPTMPVLTIGGPGAQPASNFGQAVALSGSLLVASAYNYDTTAADVGRVWVFDLAGSTPGTPVLTLDKPGTAVADDEFGYSLAISGTKVVVGCRRDDTAVDGAGKAFVYDLGTGTPSTPLAVLTNPTPEAADFFGGSVAISGNLVAVSADQDNTGALDAGTVYLYNLAGTLPAIPVTTINNPTPSGTDRFGSCLAITPSRLVVGCQLDNQGATDAGSVYVYDITSSSATLAHSLFNPAPALNDHFGSSVALAGTALVVGACLDDAIAQDAGAAYAYDLGGGTPTVPVRVMNDTSPSLTDQFGDSTAISGTRVVVGAPYHDSDAANSGVAYVYDLASATPAVPVLTIHNPTPAEDDLFGGSLAISGSLLAVTATGDDTTAAGAGAVYVFDLDSATPTVPLCSLFDPAPSANFGFAVGISGTKVLVGANFNDTGANDAGCAYVFDVASGTPATPVFTLNNPSPAVDDRFGRALAISGNRVVVGVYLDDTGATNSGCAYAYDLSGGTPTVPTVIINNPTPASSDWFARSISMSGSRVIINAWLDNTGATDAGSAYVYDLAGTTPGTPVLTLNNPEPAVSDEFGSDVAISGTRILVSASIDDAGAVDSGSVYLYDLLNATPQTPVATFYNPTPGVQDQFGSSIAIDAGLFVIAAHLDDTVSTDKGYAYVFGAAPEIAVEQPLNTGLTDAGAAISFGDFQFGASSPARIFTVRNTGITALLNLSVTKGGTSASDFSLNTGALGTSIAPGASATFTVTLTPSSAGLKTATLQVISSDLDENPFDISLIGRAHSATTDTDGDGMKDWQEFQLSSLGFNWQVANAALVNTYFSTASQNGLYTSSQVQDLNVGTPLIQQNAGTSTFTLTMAVQQAATPGGPWTLLPMTAPQTTINAQGKLEFQFTAPGPTAFFRLQSQ